MQTTRERMALGSPEQLREYNYERFQTRHVLADVSRMMRGVGVEPGTEAPDFELESTGGDRVRLSSLRGRPVVLHFGSIT